MPGCAFLGAKKVATTAAAAARVMRVGSMVRRPVSHACDARALEYVIRWQQVSMAEVVTQQSAAVRRLAALMQRDDDEAEQARQAELEQERQRAAAAQKAALVLASYDVLGDHSPEFLTASGRSEICRPFAPAGGTSKLLRQMEELKFAFTNHSSAGAQ